MKTYTRKENRLLRTLPFLISSCALLHTNVMSQSISDRLVIATPSFTLDAERLDKKVKGIDAEKLYANIWDKAPASRTEFESLADFQVKLDKFYSAVFIEKISNGSRFAIIKAIDTFPLLNYPDQFDSRTVTRKYDPEIEEMSITLNASWKCLPIKRTSLLKGKHVLENSFGKKVEVEEVDHTELCLSPPKGYYPLAFGNEDRTDKVSLDFPISTKDAEAVSKVLSVVIIGRLTQPFLDESDTMRKPTMTEPTEITRHKKALVLELDDVWILNSSSGAVLGKLRTPFQNSSPRLIERPSFLGQCKKPTYTKKELSDVALVVELAIDVDADGKVLSGSVKKSSGNSSLDERALVSISSCKFSPGRKNGIAQREIGTVKYHFDSRSALNM